MIIGVCGFIGSGKDTVADHLVSTYKFKRDSFATSVKDSLSSIFGWDRELLEGVTKESRDWREQVDEWWAERLGIPQLSPRWAMQHYATDLCRNHFHEDIWVASLENRLRNTKDNVVVTDCRFSNEIATLRSLGALIVRVKRGPDPAWFEDAKQTNLGESLSMHYRKDVHPSEWAWAGTIFDVELDNNGTLDKLYEQINCLVQGLRAAKEDRAL